MGKKDAPQVKLEELKHIQLRQTQKAYSQKICENDITFCFGPSGCLVKGEKITIYKMRTKNKNYIVNKEASRNK